MDCTTIEFNQELTQPLVVTGQFLQQVAVRGPGVSG